MIDKGTSVCARTDDEMTIEMKHEKFRQEVLREPYFQAATNLKAFFSWLKDQQVKVAAINKKLPEGNQLTLFFRGVPNWEFQNVPSINRGNFYKHEDSIFNECLIRTPDAFSKDSTTFGKLVRMQHYGIPTRLLDLTSNPLVALFFACYSRNKADAGVDGKVCAFYVSRKAIKYPDSDTVSVVANLAHCSDSVTDTSFGIDELCKYYLLEKAGLPDNSSKINAAYDEAMKSFNTSQLLLRLIGFVRKEKPMFEPRILRETLESIWAVKPQLNNARITRQDGLFLIFGVNGHKENVIRIPTIDTVEEVIDIRKKLISFELFGRVSTADKNQISDGLKKSCFSAECIKDIFGTISDDDGSFDRKSLDALERVNDFNNRKKNVEMTLRHDFTERKAALFQLWLQFAPFQKGLSSLRHRVKKSSKELDQHIKPLIFKYDASSYLLHLHKLALDILCDNPFVFYDGVRIGNKKQMLADIEPLGMTYDKLFPELDDVAEYLKEKYAKMDVAE